MAKRVITTDERSSCRWEKDCVNDTEQKNNEDCMSDKLVFPPTIRIGILVYDGLNRSTSGVLLKRSQFRVSSAPTTRARRPIHSKFFLSQTK